MWREQVKALFFVEHFNITDIANIVKKSRKTVSNYLNTLEDYDKEMLWRKKQSNMRRKENKKQYNKLYKQKFTDEDKDMLKMCHIEAVNVLSHEKYF